MRKTKTESIKDILSYLQRVELLLKYTDKISLAKIATEFNLGSRDVKSIQSLNIVKNDKTNQNPSYIWCGRKNSTFLSMASEVYEESKRHTREGACNKTKGNQVTININGFDITITVSLEKNKVIVDPKKVIVNTLKK